MIFLCVFVCANTWKWIFVGRLFVLRLSILFKCMRYLLCSEKLWENEYINFWISALKENQKWTSFVCVCVCVWSLTYLRSAQKRQYLFVVKILNCNDWISQWCCLWPFQMRVGVSEFLHPDVSKFRFYSLKFDSVWIFTFQILKI